MCADDLRPSNNDVYLIFLNQFVVAQDIAGAIAEYDPRGSAYIVTSLSEAMEVVTRARQIRVAFLAQDPKTFAGSELAVAIAARGGRAVLIGEAAEMAAPDARWSVLQRPFLTDAVLAQLQSVVSWQR